MLFSSSTSYEQESGPYRPGKPIGPFTDIDVSSHIECVQVNDRDKSILSGGNIGSGSIRLNLDTT
jgi:hypothetical protein